MTLICPFISTDAIVLSLMLKGVKKVLFRRSQHVLMKNASQFVRWQPILVAAFIAYFRIINAGPSSLVNIVFHYSRYFLNSVPNVFELLQRYTSQLLASKL